MALTVHRIKSLAPEGGKPRREADGGGLFIEATPAGSKLWKMAYRFGGRQKTLSFGAFPAVSIVDARALREQAKKDLAAGKDPGTARRGGARTFDDYAQDYIAFRARSKAAPATIEKQTWLRQALARPIGGVPIDALTVPEMLAAVRAVETAGSLHKSSRMISFISRVFRFAAGHGEQVMDPGPIIRSVSLRPEVRHHAAVTEPARIGALLRAIDAYKGDVSTVFALRLAPHLFLRDGALRALEWDWVDFQDAMISIPAGVMKMKRPHLVPMSPQVAAIMEEARMLSGRGRHVFPSPRRRGSSLSSNTLNSALRRMGYDKSEATFHGFRSTASTRLNEMPPATRGFSKQAIDLQLSHAKNTTVEAAYNRAALMDERRILMNAWSDALDEYRALPPEA